MVWLSTPTPLPPHAATYSTYEYVHEPTEQLGQSERAGTPTTLCVYAYATSTSMQSPYA